MAARAPKPADHPVYAAAEAKWKSSGLDEDHAKALHLQPLTAEETVELCPKFHPTESLKLPYFDLDGKETGFFRVRYLGKLPGFAGTVEKPQKYAQAPGTVNEVYLPPTVTPSWRNIAEDTSVPIYFTEGELKAAAGALAGLAVVGLGGVDVWRSTKRGIEVLSPLDKFKFQGRSTTIVFDSDTATKPEVLQAQRRLASKLLHLGCHVKIATIPDPKDGSKLGLDDFLVKKGPDALLELVGEAPEIAESLALWAMNEEVVYIQEPGLVVERAHGRAMDPGKFVGHHYSNRFYEEISYNKDGAAVKKRKPLARHWLDWEHRFERRKLVYAPGQPRLTAGGDWNVWPGWGVAPVKGDVSPWLWLLDFAFRGEPEARQWFERWCAYPIQHPGTKLYTACLLWSNRHGMGKGLIEYMLMSIYGKNAIEIDSQSLRGSFNAWAQRRQFVVGNEITAGEARLDKDKLKGLITRRELTINEKFVPEYQIIDCINYMFDSNSPDALFVEDNDRRYFIHELKGDPAAPAFYEKCDAFLKGDGPGRLFHHLLTLDLGDFKPLAPALGTVDKKAMILQSKSDLAYWVAGLREDPEHKLMVLGEKVAKECDLFTPQQLLRCYDPENDKRVTAPGMAREMARAGFRMVNGQTPVWTEVGSMRLYAVRNTVRWSVAPVKVLREHWEKYFGRDSRKF